ncbi:MAG: hypothetical protein WDW36_008995 [Sanguina aurantia]
MENSKVNMRILLINGMELHRDDLGGEFELHMDDVNKQCQVFGDPATPEQANMLKSPKVYAAEAVARTGVVHGAKPLILVVFMIHISNARQFAVILDAFVRHHALVGVTRVIAYLGQGISKVAQDRKLQAHVVSGRLEMLSWDGAPLVSSEEGLGHDFYGPQFAIYNHALLRFCE